jgi:hypothetical protein
VEVAVNGTEATGITHEAALAKMTLEVNAVADERGYEGLERRVFIRQRLEARSVELDRRATRRQIADFAEYMVRLNAWSNRDSVGLTPDQRVEFDKVNVANVNELIDQYKIGMGTLMTTCLLNEIEAPGDLCRASTKDVSPSCIGDNVVATTANVGKENDKDESKVMKRPSKEVIEFVELDETTKRDIRRGFGIRKIRVTRNPTHLGAVWNPKVRANRGFPKAVDHVRVIAPNGGMRSDEYEHLSLPRHGRVQPAGQFVLTYDLYMYTRPIGGFVNEFLVTDVKVCPAPAEVVAMYSRKAALNVLGDDFSSGTDVNVLRASAKRQKRAMHEKCETQATKLSLHIPEGEYRRRAIGREMVRMEYVEGQRAAAKIVAAMPDFD